MNRFTDSILETMKTPIKETNIPLSAILGIGIGLIIGVTAAIVHIGNKDTLFDKPIPEMYEIKMPIGNTATIITAPQTVQIEETQPVAEPEPQKRRAAIMNEDEMILFAKCVQAEAATQGLIGKRLVADVILNRVESDEFPDTITEVILQHNEDVDVWQFSVAGSGALDKAEPDHETYEAIRMELAERSYPGLLYFSAEGYLPYGTPWQKVGKHWFSTK